jgi:HAD superfamily hydrolase (TIGR01509 family)
MRRPKGVLLDVDGTLVDSNDAHARAWVIALAEGGVTVTFEKVRPLIGKGGDKLLPEASGIDAESPKGKAISKRRGEIFRKEFLPLLRPFPKARDLLVRMKREGLRLGVASSAKEDELKGLLRACGAHDLVEASTSSDDADNSKPDPDIVHAAIEKLGHPAEEVILLGDTPYDVEAGAKAGVSVVALRCGGWRDPDLDGAVAIYDGPEDLLGRFEGSPFAGSR